MTETQVPTVEEVWKRLSAPEVVSLMTPLGLVGGEALAYLEEHGATTVRRLIRELEWPSHMVMMAVGALIREGLVQAIQHDLEVSVELVPAEVVPSQPETERVPEAWSG